MEKKNKNMNQNTDPIGELNKESREPFVNDQGVVIGDNFYDSPNSPLNNWSKDVDPAIMAGDDWVHPTNDIGWKTRENQELLRGISPQAAPFMHPSIDVSYGLNEDLSEEEEEGI